jgi:signal transduction histidine kinase
VVTVSRALLRVIALRGDLRVSAGRARVVLQDEPPIARKDDDRAVARGYSAPVRALTSLGARVQALPPGRADLLLAGAFLLETQVELSFLDASTGTVLAARGLTLAMALGVAARRRAPLVAAAVVFAALTGMEQLGDQTNTSVVGPFTSAFIVAYSIGANLEGRALAVGVGWLMALVTALSVLDPNADEALNPLWGWLVIVAAPVLAGRLLSDRARLARALRAAAAEEDAEPWAEQAVAEERSRIAAELHDVVARALRRMVVDADGAARLVDSEPGRASLAFAAVEQTGREALAEIRRLLGVLRREDDELALAPQPTLAHIADLVRRARAAGLGVELHVEGEAAALPAGADLTAYRVVQQALAGAVRDGAAAGASVTVRYGADAVDVEVVDDGTARPAPMGIAERVALYGGELTTATARDGGQALRARLPLGSAA